MAPPRRRVGAVAGRAELEDFQALQLRKATRKMRKNRSWSRFTVFAFGETALARQGCIGSGWEGVELVVIGRGRGRCLRDWARNIARSGSADRRLQRNPARRWLGWSADANQGRGGKLGLRVAQLRDACGVLRRADPALRPASGSNSQGGQLATRRGLVVRQAFLPHHGQP